MGERLLHTQEVGGSNLPRPPGRSQHEGSRAHNRHRPRLRELSNTHYGGRDMPKGGAARRVVKQMFSTVGLEISRRRRYRMRVSMAEALGHLKSLGYEPAAVVDVGVGNGTFDLYDAFPDASFLLIEPLKEFRPVLEDIAQRFRASYVLAAAGRAGGSTVIFVHAYLEGSSVLQERGEQTGIVAREVEMVALDDVCEEKRLTGPI